jgi:hypothetical protein
MEERGGGRGSGGDCSPGAGHTARHLVLELNGEAKEAGDRRMAPWAAAPAPRPTTMAVAAWGSAAATAAGTSARRSGGGGAMLGTRTRKRPTVETRRARCECEGESEPVAAGGGPLSTPAMWAAAQERLSWRADGVSYEYVTNMDRMLVSVNGAFFRWYFTWPRSFNGVFRNGVFRNPCSFNAIQPIFPFCKCLFIPKREEDIQVNLISCLMHVHISDFLPQTAEWTKVLKKHV